MRGTCRARHRAFETRALPPSLIFACKATSKRRDLVAAVGAWEATGLFPERLRRPFITPSTRNNNLETLPFLQAFRPCRHNLIVAMIKRHRHPDVMPRRTSLIPSDTNTLFSQERESTTWIEHLPTPRLSTHLKRIVVNSVQQ